MYSHTEFTLSINSFFVSHNTLVKSSNFGTQDEMHFLWLQFLAFHRRAYNINLLTAKFGTKNNRYDLITIKIRFTCFKLYANYLQRNIFCNIISINHLPNYIPLLRYFDWCQQLSHTIASWAASIKRLDHYHKQTATASLRIRSGINFNVSFHEGASFV